MLHAADLPTQRAPKVRLEAEAYLPGTDGSNPFPSCAESAANFVFGREAWKGPRRRQGTIPTVSTSSGTDSSNPAPSTRESGANLSEPIEVHTLTKGWTGTRLIREWQGRTYEVVVLDDGFS